MPCILETSVLLRHALWGGWPRRALPLPVARGQKGVEDSGYGGSDFWLCGISGILGFPRFSGCGVAALGKDLGRNVVRSVGGLTEMDMVGVLGLQVFQSSHFRIHISAEPQNLHYTLNPKSKS